jgi:hypothetical protein
MQETTLLARSSELRSEAKRANRDRVIHHQTRTHGAPMTSYERPTIEVISLSCEISAYAPDGRDEGEQPLF